MKLSLFTVSVLGFVVMSFAQSLESWIVRLSPTAFPELPANLVQELQRRGCTIPQEAYSKTKPNNLIKGEFAKPGQRDWAVLCSVNRSTTLLAFRNDRDTNPDTVNTSDDRSYLQGREGGEISYSREITAAGRDFILRHYRAYGGPEPPPIDHQGIDDAFVGKASVTWYFHRGKWLRLQGAD